MKMVLTICLTMMMSSVFADTSLTYVNNGQANMMQIKNGILRSTDGVDYMLYNSKTHTMTVVDHNNKSYSRIDENTMKQMGSALSEMQQQIQEQLKNLPPEQQEQMRQMMGGGMGELQPLRSQKTSKTAKSGEWSCNMVDVFKGDEKISQVCVADYESLNVSENDYLVMKDFMGFITSIAEKIPMGKHASFPSSDLGDGMLPVIVEGSHQASMRLEKVSNDSLDAALFTVPAGYAEHNMMEEMRR